jgi:hypothetical protein
VLWNNDSIFLIEFGIPMEPIRLVEMYVSEVTDSIELRPS